MTTRTPTLDAGETGLRRTCGRGDGDRRSVLAQDRDLELSRAAVEHRPAHAPESPFGQAGAQDAPGPVSRALPR